MVRLLIRICGLSIDKDTDKGLRIDKDMVRVLIMILGLKID